VHLDARGQARELFFELVSSGYLEGHHGHLPRFRRWGEGLFEAAHVKNENLRGPQRGRPSDRYRAHQATVEVVLPVDLNGREQARYRA
jgi:hypothetical protein